MLFLWKLLLNFVALDCEEIMILLRDNYQAGVKTLTINDTQIQVYCDEDGWTTIQS